ncbi:RING finger protein 10 isoform X1 [Aplysia californica]|uniref:E3 ubiquitin-protein ligase RNF10 n=1 Tax=Aplysia californica TaxID=6500 RepID=A0ABM0KA41_APLCA|nr:RING finger protein 10 isoform X1 [Aplysia californica]
MLEESSYTMEKKTPTRPLPVQSKTSATPERKSDYSNKNNGRRRWKDNVSPGGRSLEPAQLPVKPPPQRWNRGNGDKRPRQRGYYGDRQREEVAEVDDAPEVYSTSSRKGNANNLLRFHYGSHDEGSRSAGRWSGYRGGGGHGRQRKTVRYNKEQFLQASCQFVVQDNGEYSQQAVDPDALVKWDLVELVRVFSTESVLCPICRSVPYAGQITKCGHIYCLACMIRYLALGDKDYRRCPICYDAVKTEDLRSVRWVKVPDYKVGDTIELKLMRKSKGSVYVCPKKQWTDRQGVPHNLLDGENTKFAKLLVAGKEEIQREVIEVEKADLAAQMKDAHVTEEPFIAMAQETLKNREENLQATRSLAEVKPSAEAEQEDEAAKESELVTLSDVLLEEAEEITKYSDAFEDMLEDSSFLNVSALSHPEDTEMEGSMASLDRSDGAIFSLEGLKEGIETEDTKFTPVAESLASLPAAAADGETSQKGDDTGGALPDSAPTLGAEVLPPPLPKIDATSARERGDSEGSLPCGSPVNPFPLLEDHLVSQVAVSTDEVFDNLELPHAEAPPQAKRVQPTRTKDTYYFYQASSGQHIYMHSLNARCLQQEYGSLEHGPETISASIVAIKRMFMTEDVRKRLRYLNHIPLTCEFHVVELNLKQPLVSKETLKMFRGEIEALRKDRQKKAREEKRRAKELELEHKKAHGIYPDVNLRLDSQRQFPSHLSTSTAKPGSQGEEDTTESTSDTFERSSSSQWTAEEASSSSTYDGQEAAAAGLGPQSGSPMSPRNSAWDSKSFAKIAGAGAWPTVQRWRSVSESQPTPVIAKSPNADDSDGEGHPAPSYNASMAAAFDSLDTKLQAAATEPEVMASPGPAGSGKKKKKKEKQVLFSTSMARKN